MSSAYRSHDIYASLWCVRVFVPFELVPEVELVIDALPAEGRAFHLRDQITGFLLGRLTSIIGDVACETTAHDPDFGHVVSHVAKLRYDHIIAARSASRTQQTTNTYRFSAKSEVAVQRLALLTLLTSHREAYAAPEGFTPKRALEYLHEDRIAGDVLHSHVALLPILEDEHFTFEDANWILGTKVTFP